MVGFCKSGHMYNLTAVLGYYTWWLQSVQLATFIMTYSVYSSNKLMQFKPPVLVAQLPDM